MKPKLSELIAAKKPVVTTVAVRPASEVTQDVLGLEGISSDDIINKVKDLFKRQLELKEDSSIAEIENIRMQRSALIEGIEGLIQLRHLGEVIKNNDRQFKREDEIEILENQLKIYKSMSSTLESQLNFFNEELGKHYKKLSDINDKLLDLAEQESTGAMVQAEKAQLTEAQFFVKETITYYTTSIEEAVSTLRKATSGISELIKTERISGSRNWGEAGKGGSNATLMLSGGGGRGKGGKKGDGGDKGGENALQKLMGRLGPLSVPTTGELKTVEEEYVPNVINNNGDTQKNEK